MGGVFATLVAVSLRERIAIAILSVNNLAVFVTNSLNQFRCRNIKRATCSNSNTTHISADFLSTGYNRLHNVASLKTFDKLVARSVPGWKAKFISSAHLARTVSSCFN